ncbi:MAG: hypothetical protein JW798_14425 [Prolixibacteraceae bacterium]|nr:hypothetical protein [Prolixibacteraceae bacterium]
MRIVVPVNGSDNNAVISRHFARSTHFAIIDKLAGTREIIENPFASVSKGAGMKLVDFLLNKYKVNTIVAFELGLKVQQVASGKKMQLIIISGKMKQLKHVLTLIFPNDEQIKK